jgi:hypothetical protein
MPLIRNPEKIATIVNAVECHPTWSDKRIAVETHTSSSGGAGARRRLFHC